MSKNNYFLDCSADENTYKAISSVGVPQLPRPEPSRLISFLITRVESINWYNKANYGNLSEGRL